MEDLEREMAETDSDMQKLGLFQGKVLATLEDIKTGIKEIKEDAQYANDRIGKQDTRMTKAEALLESGGKRFASHEADIKELDKALATKVGKEEFDEKLDTKVRGLLWKIVGGMAGTGAGGGGLWFVFDMLSKGPQ